MNRRSLLALGSAAVLAGLLAFDVGRGEGPNCTSAVDLGFGDKTALELCADGLTMHVRVAEGSTVVAFDGRVTGMGRSLLVHNYDGSGPTEFMNLARWVVPHGRDLGWAGLATWYPRGTESLDEPAAGVARALADHMEQHRPDLKVGRRTSLIRLARRGLPGDLSDVGEKGGAPPAHGSNVRPTPATCGRRREGTAHHADTEAQSASVWRGGGPRLEPSSDVAAGRFERLAGGMPVSH